MTLVGLVLVALMSPLITTYASDRTQDFFVSRLGDVTRFAVLAEDTLARGDADALTLDLRRYSQVYGSSVLVANANRQVVASSRPDLDISDVRVRRMVEHALSGRTSEPPATAWPWSERTIVIGSPVGRDAQVLGAVVMVAPTDTVRDSVRTWMLWLVLAGLVILLLTVFVVVAPFVGWVMRPVHDLDAAARRLSAGDLDSRAHQLGPPELRELARSFNAMADSVQVSQQQQRDLVADAAHQLGNPLTSLRLRVENLAASAAEDHEVALVLEETDRLTNIVESLLDLSQVGARTVQPAPVDVAAAARHRCDLWEPVFASLSVRAPRAAWALATAGLVDLVLDALLDNASKYAAGAPVTVWVTREGDRVVLGVADRGPGLDEEDVTKVGARFFRGRRHQNVPGTGLGLAIVRASVEGVGGSLRVTSGECGGLRAEVVLVGVSGDAPGSSAPPPGAAPTAR